MLVTALLGLAFSALIFAAGLWLMQNWRIAGEFAGQLMCPRLLFGAAGERVLMALGFVLMAGGVYVASQSLLVITSA